MNSHEPLIPYNGISGLGEELLIFFGKAVHDGDFVRTFWTLGNEITFCL